MENRKDLLEVIGQIYEASYRPEEWPNTLKAVSDLTQSKSASLIYRDTIYPEASFTVSWGIPSETLIAYKEEYCAIDPFFELTSGNPLGSVSTDHTLVPNRQELEALCGKFFTNYMKPHDHFHIGGATLFDDKDKMAAIAIQRGQGSGPWSDTDLEQLTELVPHFQRAFNIYNEFTRLKLQEQALYNIVDSIILGIIIVNADQQVVYTNPMADRVTKEHSSISVIEHRLRFNYNRDHEIFQTKFLEAQHHAAQSQTYSSVMGLESAIDELPISLMVARLSQSHLLSFAGNSAGNIVLFISDPNQKQEISGSVLSLVYGLSPKEANVAVALANGFSIDEISKNSSRSIHTIRTQLKNIFQKTGATSQGQLIKLLIRGSFLAPTEIG